MVMPKGIGIIDTMIGFPANDFSQYDFIRKQLKDGSTDLDFPVEYMFKNVPKELYGNKDPISVTLHEMDRFGVEIGLIGAGGDVSRKALHTYPDRFIAQGGVDPNKGKEGIRDMVRQYEESRRSRMLIALATAETEFANEDEFELAVSAVGSLGVRGIRDGRDVTEHMHRYLAAKAKAASGERVLA